jgi:hypothetical protein
MTRTTILTLENNKVGDGLFNPEVVETLKRYVEMVEAGNAGYESSEIYRSPGGTTLKVLSSIRPYEILPGRLEPVR